jgi:hypothetical protein
MYYFQGNKKNSHSSVQFVLLRALSNQGIVGRGSLVAEDSLLLGNGILRQSDL